jgi:hypothetical protein
VRKLGPMPDPILSFVTRSTLKTLVKLHNDESIVHNGLTTYELYLGSTVSLPHTPEPLTLNPKLHDDESIIHNGLTTYELHRRATLNPNP